MDAGEGREEPGCFGVDLLLSNKWRARMRVKGNPTYLGTYASKIEAQQAYDSVAHHLGRGCVWVKCCPLAVMAFNLHSVHTFVMFPPSPHFNRLNLCTSIHS